VFDRFTDDARKTFALSREEALRLNHVFIGTEHILLGLVQEGTGIGARVLKNLRVDPNVIRQMVEQLVEPGPSIVTMRQLPFTPGAKRVLELALDEAASLFQNFIGTEHILVALIREREGKAAQVLAKLNVKLEIVRREIMSCLREPRSP
jgi:ATP-dependent Clp protease ATP-binding subunit ClpC